MEDTTLIQVIYGSKGSGKTKQIVDLANETAKQAKGVVVYLDRSNHRMHDLHRNIRLVDASHFGLTDQKELVSFIKGMIAANFDIEHVFIDGLSRLFDCNIVELGEVYQGLDKLAKEFSINFTITASGDVDELPDFVKKYIG